MEISSNIVFFTVLTIIGLVYLLYSTSCNNYVLSHELDKKGGINSDDSSSDNDSDDEYNKKQKTKNKKQKGSKKNKGSISTLFSKGVKAYSSSNDLEEIPKFL
jgi:hypothetical protein